MVDCPPGFLTSAEACSILGVSDQTLRRWEQQGQIDAFRAPGKNTHRKYNVQKFLNNNTNFDNEKSDEDEVDRRRICYCRVSTRNQKDDLERQVEFMRKRYPDHEIIRDIGSGLNFKRKGLQTILDSAFKGEIEEVVVAYRDRLCRFGFELYERIIEEYSDGKIVVLNNIKCSPEEELTQDLLSIITIFSARINGLRKYKTEIEKDKNISQSKSEKNSN